VGLIRLDASPDRPQPPAASDARDLGRFTSSEAERQYVAAYDEVLALWPIPVTNLTVSTPFADTHVIASGPEAGPPLVLLHATGMSSTGWFPNAGALGRMHRTFAVDIANEPGRTRQTSLLRDPADCATWLLAVLDELAVSRATLIGSSHGVGFPSTLHSMRLNAWRSSSSWLRRRRCCHSR
jgi:hypothetical protein